MSCEVKTYASVPDLQKVQELLGFAHDENWLNAVYYSISPTGDVITFGHGSRIVILSLAASWATHSSHQKSVGFSITWSGELENPNDIITSLICLPIYGHGGESNGVDWTCVVIGLASGLVVFYSDSGMQVFSQRWHQEPVQSIKAQSGSSASEEVHIGYISCMCIVQGVQLFPLLKALKQNLSRQVTHSNRRADLVQFPETVACRKWEYRTRSGSSINDAVVVGPPKSCAFDHLLEQSLTSGFHTKTKAAPPQNSLVLGVGVKPYVGFYYAKEGFVRADLGDVAKAVANKVMSSLPGWLFKSSTAKPDPEQEQPIPPGEPMSCRFGICDLQRQALNIWLAPGNELAVVADTLSRVILIDCNRGVALRIWKGYRDAQCAFVKVKEKTLKGDKTKKRTAMFLVIYAPRRSCLEIWALQNGPKVAAFTVSKNGQLLYNTHSLMAITPGTRMKNSAITCLFIDPSDETLKEIVVPFHCALSDGNSKTSKDVHLLRRMKMFVRSHDDTTTVVAEIESLCTNVQTDEIRLQCLDMLAKNKRVHPIVFKTAVDSLMKVLDGEEELKEMSSEAQENRRSLVNLLNQYNRLVEFYLAVIDPPPVSEDEEVIHASGVQLNFTVCDLETVQRLIDLKQVPGSAAGSKVHFGEDSEGSGDFVDFLSVFSIESSELRLNPDKAQIFGFIGTNLFKRFLEKGHSLNGFVEIAEKSTITSEDLMALVLHSWLEKPFEYAKSEEVIDDMSRLAQLIQAICDLADEKIVFTYSSICDWWQGTRELLLESRCALRGLLAAIVCRNISKEQQKKIREGSCNSCEEAVENEADNWEKVTHEAAQWSLLIGKLEDISILGAVLGSPTRANEPFMPPVEYEKPDCSLKRILCSGKGIVSELTAKWLVHSGIHPKEIVEPETKSGETEIGKDAGDLDKEHEEPKSNSELLDPVLHHLFLLRKHFPFSLESGVLLCHMAWEYMSHWSKNLHNLAFLKAGMACLDAFRQEDLALKHGISCMIWNAHMKIPLESTKKLIHKTGKLPTEKLCQQDIGMSVSSVAEYLEFCLQFLQHFWMSLECEKRELKFDEILTEDQIPLPFLALQQNHAIREILDVHIQLCKVLHLIAFFQLKVPKPITTVFDAMANQTFFAEINRELQYVLPGPDIVLQKQREGFLCKAISASMDLIREDLEGLFVEEHANYMNRMEELADMWKLEKTGIRRHQVVELYAHGWDVYAEELLEHIANDEDLGTMLLEIAARRMNLYASQSQSAYLSIASVGPQLLNYLDNIKTKTSGTEITASSPDEIELHLLTTLTARAFRCLSQKNSKSVHLAGQMYDACALLKADAAKTSRQ